MAAISKWDSPVFTEAFLVWTAHGRAISPRYDDAAVVARFGTEAASELIPSMNLMLDEFYLSDAWRTAANPPEMYKKATTDFRVKHPEVADKVLEALGWCYTFDYK